MRENIKGRILFCGYAPIHFICFQPIYKRLSKIPNLDIYLSEGERAKQDGAVVTFDLKRLCRTFNIPGNKILTAEQMKKQDFDMVLCSFVSGAFPRTDKVRIHLFHGVSFRNVAIRRDILIYDYLFVVGPYQRRIIYKNKLMREGDPRLVPVGFPKLDPLMNGSINKRKILKQFGFSGRKPVVLYAPTGQKQNSLETVGEEVISRLKKLNKYDLLIKPHDHPRDRTVDWFKKLKKFEDKHLKLIRNYDIVPYLYSADLLLSDASSVSSEFTLLDRPMVFIDVPELIKNVKNKNNSIDLDTWGRKAGTTARWPDEILDAIEWSLKHPQKASSLRRKMAKDMFFNPGHATDKAVDWIVNWFKNLNAQPDEKN